MNNLSIGISNLLNNLQSLRNPDLFKSVPGRVTVDKDYKLIARISHCEVAANLSQKWSEAAAIVEEGLSTQDDQLILDGFSKFEAQGEWMPVVDAIGKKYHLERSFPTIGSFTELMKRCLGSENHIIRRRAQGELHRVIYDCQMKLSRVDDSWEDKGIRFRQKCYRENAGAITAAIDDATSVLKEYLSKERDFDNMGHMWWFLGWIALDAEFLVQMAQRQLAEQPELVDSRLSYVLPRLLKRVDAELAEKFSIEALKAIRQHPPKIFKDVEDKYLAFVPSENKLLEG